MSVVLMNEKQSRPKERLELLNPKLDVVFSYLMVLVERQVLAIELHLLWIKLGFHHECYKNSFPHVIGPFSCSIFVLFNLGVEPRPKNTSPIFLSDKEAWTKLHSHFVSDKSDEGKDDMFAGVRLSKCLRKLIGPRQSQHVGTKPLI